MIRASSPEARLALFAVELDRRLRGRGVRATAAHPGAIDTDLGRFGRPATRGGFEAAINRARDANVAQGLAPDRQVGA